MKFNKKSNVTNYRQIYSVLLFACTFFILYIVINFLLPVAHFIALFFLSLSLFCLILFGFTKELIHLALAFIGAALTIALSLAFIYLS